MPSEGALAERAASSAGAGPRVVVMRRETVPVNLLLAREDTSKLPPGVVQTREQLRRTQREIDWANKREHVFAAVAAGVHLASFAFNLAFWGFEGMPPDRYWPSQPRIRLGIRTGRYGNLQGAGMVHMDNMALWEGVKS